MHVISSLSVKYTKWGKHIIDAYGISEQLAAQDEEKKARKEGQLVGDGLLRLLTGDEFYQ